MMAVLREPAVLRRGIEVIAEPVEELRRTNGRGSRQIV